MKKQGTYVTTIRISAKTLSSLYLAGTNVGITYDNISKLIKSSLEEYLEMLINAGIAKETASEDEAWKILNSAGLTTKRSKASNNTIIRRVLQEESLDGDVFKDFLNTRRKTKRELERITPESKEVLEVIKNLRGKGIK